MKRDYSNPRAEAFYNEFTADLSELPFSFNYAGQNYNGFPAESFPVINKSSETRGDTQTNRFLLTAGGNLRVGVVTRFYRLYGAYEWTVSFTNAGDADTGVIENVKSADMAFTGEGAVLSGILGDHGNLYKPYAYDLTKDAVHFKSVNGRPTHIWFPYFNLTHNGGGALIALGWGGTWEAGFAYENGVTRYTATGVNGLKTYLKPGETIRTALTLVIPYEVRGEHYATNLWRAWYIECNMPKSNAAGDDLRPFSTACLANDTGLPNADGSISERHYTWKPSMQKIINEGIRLNYRWFDAGWYTDPHGRTAETEWWETIGSWEIDREKWPGDTFKQSVEWGHANGVKTLVWFEPERVTHVEGLTKNYGYKAEWAVAGDKNAVGNNIGDRGCLDWTLKRIIKFMDENDIDMYREDNNSDPAPYWKNLDEMEGMDRAGISESKAVAAHYELWDGIIDFCRRNGKDTFVDSCASGGGRNDLESMRRGIPLLRSDSDRTTTALRLSMQTSFNKWIPFCGCATVEQAGQLELNGKRDKYIFRASYNPVLNLSAQWTMDKTTDYGLLRYAQDEWDSVKGYFLKEFYVLTEWNGPEDTTNWTCYMYYDPVSDAGVLFAFRMEDAGAESCTVTLDMLDLGRAYAVTNKDANETTHIAGRELNRGFIVRLPQKRASALFFIKGE